MKQEQGDLSNHWISLDVNIREIKEAKANLGFVCDSEEIRFPAVVLTLSGSTILEAIKLNILLPTPSACKEAASKLENIAAAVAEALRLVEETEKMYEESWWNGEAEDEKRDKEQWLWVDLIVGMAGAEEDHHVDRDGFAWDSYRLGRKGRLKLLHY